MTERNHQLFRLLREVEIPDYMAAHDGTLTGLSRSIPATFAMRWPDGSPCVLVEMYLLDIGETITVRSVDGGSLRVVVSSLSHLVRYCWKANLDFHELNDDTFHKFVTGLCGRGDGENRTRNKNTIRRIIEHCISFFEWLQTYVYRDVVIVGTGDRSPRITLRRRTYHDRSHGKKMRLEYAFTTPDDITDPKRPMPRHIRNQLWDAVAKLDSVDTAAHRLLSKAYMRARRELVLALMEAIGCRPGELAMLKVSKNVECVSRKSIIIDTLKLRRGEQERSVPIDFGTALRVESFINGTRQDLISAARRAGRSPHPVDRIFLSARDASPVEAPTLEKDFWRLATSANLSQRACLSMFRHRFITNMVKREIEGYLYERPGGESLRLTDADLRTILRRVVPFTRHRRVESLLHYVDLASEEMTTFDYADAARELVRLVESSFANVSLVASQLVDVTTQNPSDAVRETRHELQRLAAEIRSSIDNFSRAALRRRHSSGGGGETRHS